MISSYQLLTCGHHDLFELENEEKCASAKDLSNEVIVREDEFGKNEEDELSLHQLYSKNSGVKANKRKSVNNDKNLIKKVKNVDCEVSRSKDHGDEGNEIDVTINPYSTQALIEDLSTPNVQIGCEGLYSIFDGGAVSYGRAQKPKTTKEYMNVVKVNLSMISDIIVETHDTIDQAIIDYPECVEFKRLKEVMHKKFSAEAVEDTQFFDSPTVIKSIDALEKSALEAIRMKSVFSMDVDKKTRRLSFEGPNFDLGISQMIFEEAGVDVDRSIHDKEHGSGLAVLPFNSLNPKMKSQTKNDAEPGTSLKGKQFETPKAHSSRVQNALVISELQGGKNGKQLVSGTHSSKLTLNGKHDRIDTEGVYPIAFDAVPLSSVKPEVNQKYAKRETKPSYVMLSPYVKRDVCVYGNVSVVEKRIANSIFAARLPEEDIIFKTHSVECQRGILESMFPGITMVSGVIDVWCLVLNYEERLRNPNKVPRLFCNTSMVTEDMLLSDDEFEKMYPIFYENMSNVLSHSILKSVDDIDLVFFPINHVNHYYVLCYNLMTGKLHILDNMVSAEMDLKKRYGNLPIVLTSLFVGYLSMNHPQANKLKDPITKVLKLGWKTEGNFVDCGVFVMRHMEMYKGDGTAGGFKTGFF